MDHLLRKWIAFALTLTIMLFGVAVAETPSATDAFPTNASVESQPEPTDEPAQGNDSTAEPQPVSPDNASAEDVQPAADALADWTVMLYLCGTDLESNQQMATANLLEIEQTHPNENVNFVIQTGGTREWHASEQIEGLDIATDKLQRYRFDTDGFTLDSELPLASMSTANTLTDFVQWGAQAYPAQKYMLVLWDHGGGSFSGIICDELYNRSIMQLEDLERSLKNANVPLEAVVMDACLMANLETCQVLQPYAHYLIASEETVPSDGSSYTTWLQYLYDTPTCDGARFGRVFCDAIQQKYAELGTTDQATLTFSTIDLTKMDAVNEAFDQMFIEVGQLLADPEYFLGFGYLTQHTQTYYSPQMIDLADLAVKARNLSLSNETAGAVLEAVENAVVYTIKGSAQSYSHGMSFYYAPQDSLTRLDHYARCCKSAPYLAFLDAANLAWTAPDWVYEQTERLPDIRREDYLVEMEATIDENGEPLLTVTNAKSAVAMVDVQLFSYDKSVDSYVLLGTDVNVSGSFSDCLFGYHFDGLWPSVAGIPCEMDLKDELDAYALYQIPFITESQMAAFLTRGNNFNFRAGFVYDKPVTEEGAADETATDETATDEAAVLAETTVADEAATSTTLSDNEELTGSYELYGIWNNINSSSGLASRDVWDLSYFNGETVFFIRNGINPYTGDYVGSVLTKSFVLGFDNAVLAETALPKGSYGMVFVVKDVFGNAYRSDPIAIEWNGKNAVYSMME